MVAAAAAGGTDEDTLQCRYRNNSIEISCAQNKSVVAMAAVATTTAANCFCESKSYFCFWLSND